MATKREDLLFKKTEAEEEAKYRRKQGRNIRVVKANPYSNEYFVRDYGTRKISKNKISKKPRIEKAIGRISKALFPVRKKRSGSLIRTNEKKLSDLQIRNKLLERKRLIAMKILSSKASPIEKAKARRVLGL